MRLLMLLTMLALVGCTTLPATSLSPEQLKAINADKNITIVCSSVNTLTTDVVNVYAVIDKSTIPNGALSISNACDIQLMTGTK